jgi:hypothetical protein
MTQFKESARSTLSVGGKDYEIFRLDSIPGINLERLPYSL